MPSCSAIHLNCDEYRGFSLIEILVALVLISSAAVALLSLQGSSLSHLRDVILRTQAIYLADDMLEMLRAVSPDQRAALYLLPGQHVPTVTGRVCESPGSLACWHGRIATVLTADEQLLSRHVHVCPSDGEGRCSASAGVVEIQLAWRSTGEHCATFNREESVCYYRLRSRLP